jgi:CheY-like chemotaxis protein
MKKPPFCFLIDNDPEDQEIFEMAMDEVFPGMPCAFANNGIAALNSLRDDQFVPAIIFIDMNMPMMSGKECLQQIKKLDHLQNVPIFMYSTAATPSAIREVKTIGATDFIVKPSTYPALVASLSDVIQVAAV